MCWFYMGIAQTALDPPPLCQTGKTVLQTILVSPYNPGQMWEKKCSKPSWQAFREPVKNVLVDFVC